MSDPGDRPVDPGDRPVDPTGAAEPDRAEEVEAVARRRRRAAVFGEVLPESTGDERADWGEGRTSGSEEWLRAQVPPHHG